MKPPQIRILGRNDVVDILESCCNRPFEIVRRAYESFGRGEVVNPHSSFLVPHELERARIIALPAAILSDSEALGIKWIASFPQNVDKGLERASAVIVLNDPKTGFPVGILEGAMISATRTALSAALAASCLNPAKTARSLAVIGCGLIARQTLLALRSQGWEFSDLILFDNEPARARDFEKSLDGSGVAIVVANCAAEAVREGEIVIFATTAGKPWFDDHNALCHNPVVLHLSLRDISPQIIGDADNYVDDIDHASRASTSLQLALQQYGREIVQITDMPALLARIGDRDNRKPAIFSPFGLGMLDIALANYVLERANDSGKGRQLNDFYGSTAS